LVPRSDDVGSEMSDFLGGYRMEHLLQALHHESEAGSFFRRFVEKSGNKVSVPIDHRDCNT